MKKYIDFTRLIAYLQAEIPCLIGESAEALTVTDENGLLCIRVEIQKLGCVQKYPKEELNRFYNEIGERPNVYLLYHFKKYFDEIKLKYGAVPDT